MKSLAKLLCAVLIGSSAPAWADLSRDEAAATAQQLTNGRVLSVEKTQAAGRPAWRVKLVTPKGDVMVILIDASSGRVI